MLVERSPIKTMSRPVLSATRFSRAARLSICGPKAPNFPAPLTDAIVSPLFTAGAAEVPPAMYTTGLPIRLPPARMSPIEFFLIR